MGPEGDGCGLSEQGAIHLTPTAMSLASWIAEGFQKWVGWGWAAAFLVWGAGTIFILTIVYRKMMERFGSRLPTAAIFVLWTLAVLGVTSSYLGFGPPGGP
jgi:hypothetical protein